MLQRENDKYMIKIPGMAARAKKRPALQPALRDIGLK
jgi:hypothetical protein